MLNDLYLYDRKQKLPSMSQQSVSVMIKEVDCRQRTG